MASHQLETRSLLCEKLGVKQLKETCIDQYANNFLSISGQKILVLALFSFLPDYVANFKT
jgi:hypothetical protein